MQRDTQGAASNAYDLHQRKLHAYAEQPDGTWTRTSYVLPNFPTGLNQRGYPDAGNGIDAPVGIAARDGSLILLGTRQTSNNGAVTAPATVPGAWRVVLDGGQATATAIPGTEVENSTSGVFDALRPGPDGQITLFRTGSLGSGIPHVVQTLTVSETGTVEVGPRRPATAPQRRPAARRSSASAGSIGSASRRASPRSRSPSRSRSWPASSPSRRSSSRRRLAIPSRRASGRSRHRAACASPI